MRYKRTRVITWTDTETIEIHTTPPPRRPNRTGMWLALAGVAVTVLVALATAHGWLWGIFTLDQRPPDQPTRIIGAQAE